MELKQVKLKQIAKSKTMQFNAVATLILYILPLFGVPVTPEVVGAVYAIGNIILRFITKEAISDK